MDRSKQIAACELSGATGSKAQRSMPYQGATSLVAQSVSVAFGKTRVIHKIALELFPGETLVVLGDSGCGKTTLLRVLAGQLRPDTGTIHVEQQEIFNLPAKERGIVYLDQEALLFEHLTVFENVAFGLRLRRVGNVTLRAQVEEMLAAVNLSQHGAKRSWQLSGGQKQRIAFARAILARPRVLLLDEPFGSLDSKARAEMQQLYRKLAAAFRFTALFVTHDIREALIVGDRFSWMSDGNMETYAGRAEFVADDRTGVQAELRFWQELSQETRSDT